MYPHPAADGGSGRSDSRTSGVTTIAITGSTPTRVRHQHYFHQHFGSGDVTTPTHAHSQWHSQPRFPTVHDLAYLPQQQHWPPTYHPYTPTNSQIPDDVEAALLTDAAPLPMPTLPHSSLHERDPYHSHFPFALYSNLPSPSASNSWEPLQQPYQMEIESFSNNHEPARMAASSSSTPQLARVVTDPYQYHAVLSQPPPSNQQQGRASSRAESDFSFLDLNGIESMEPEPLALPAPTVAVNQPQQQMLSSNHRRSTTVRSFDRLSVPLLAPASAVITSPPTRALSEACIADRPPSVGSKRRSSISSNSLGDSPTFDDEDSLECADISDDTSDDNGSDTKSASSHGPGCKPAMNRSLIHCHAIDAVTGERLQQHYSPFFAKVVEVYHAEIDPHRRVLYRASTLAEKFDCATNKVGMYLARRRHKEDGLYQSTGFIGKPPGRSGLKIGGYFVSERACREFERHYQQQQKGKKRGKRRHYHSTATSTSSGGSSSVNSQVQPLSVQSSSSLPTSANDVDTAARINTPQYTQYYAQLRTPDYNPTSGGVAPLVSLSALLQVFSSSPSQSPAGTNSSSDTPPLHPQSHYHRPQFSYETYPAPRHPR